MMMAVPIVIRPARDYGDEAETETEGMTMPQLILLAVVGVVAYFGYRSFVKEAERVTARVRRAERQRATGAHGTLVKDPKTGEYRLARD